MSTDRRTSPQSGPSSHHSQKPKPKRKRKSKGAKAKERKKKEADGGFILIKRTDYRKKHGRNALVSAPKTSNSHTCVVDAVWYLSLFALMRGLWGCSSTNSY